jgi:outer membrane protein OmpA-like peptidoglycan-associated protein
MNRDNKYLRGQVMKKLMLFTVLLCGFSAMAIAQGVPRFELFGGYSYNRCDTEEFSQGSLDSACNLNGWNASIAVNANKWAGIVGDFGGHYGSIDLNGNGANSWDKTADIQIHSVMIGPKFTLRMKRISPFAQALVGWGKPTIKEGPDLLVKDNDFAMAFGGGLDININDYFAVRPVQVDYFPIKSGNSITDNFRYSAGGVLKLAVSNDPPTVSCAVSDASILQGDTTTIRANAVDPEGARLTYSWSASGGKITSDEDTATFDATGLAPGTYRVTGTVRDKKNEVSCSSEITVLKRNQPPTASVEPSSFSVVQGGSQNLRCIGNDPNNDALTYSWSVNGERLAAAGPQITFGSEGRAPGAYKVVCEVSDGEESASASSSGTVTMKPNKPPTVECLTTTLDVASGSSIELRARASDPDGDQLTYTWSATGGTVRGRGETATFNAAGVSAGSYTVTVTVQDSRDGKSSCTMTVNVSERISVTKEDCGYFRHGAARVDNCAKAILDDIAVRMRNNSSLRANIIGYTDNSPYETSGSRKDLGERRAQAAADYLESQGVNASRMTITNGGTNDPVGDNSTEAGRKLNRRVEIELSVR